MKINLINKFWDKKNPLKSEVIGRCGGDEKNEWPRSTDKSNANRSKSNRTKKQQLVNIHVKQKSIIYTLELHTFMNAKNNPNKQRRVPGNLKQL